MKQLSFDFGPQIPRVCDGCGRVGKFKRLVCFPCHWAETKPYKPSTPEQREKWRAYSRARYYKIQREARA
jgi:hypothetical protein